MAEVFPVVGSCKKVFGRRYTYKKNKPKNRCFAPNMIIRKRPPAQREQTYHWICASSKWFHESDFFVEDVNYINVSD